MRFPRRPRQWRLHRTYFFAGQLLSASGTTGLPNSNGCKARQWVEAVLSEPLSENTWVEWRVDWDPEPGVHFLRVRATDGEGELQTEMERPPAPDGATGWHTQRVLVEGAA